MTSASHQPDGLAARHRKGPRQSLEQAARALRQSPAAALDQQRTRKQQRLALPQDSQILELLVSDQIVHAQREEPPAHGARSEVRDLFLSVPSELQDGAAALGATRWEVIRGVVLPTTTSGVIAACLLGLGRALGEKTSAAIRASSFSFCARASAAISRTASNSSRLTRSMPAIRRSSGLRASVSTSRRAPSASPAASVIKREMSSNSRPRV